MGSIEVKRSAQFDSFVAFAQKAMAAGDTKAVARADDTVTETGGLASRSIKAATTDKAFALFRSKTDKADNNAARDLFRQSVIDMFGSESKIPPDVKDAMLLKDYEVGKPLTARRIMAVKHAIEQALDPAVPKVDKITASTLVSFAVRTVNAMHAAKRTADGELPGIHLTTAQSGEAQSLVRKYGQGLSEKGLQMLSNFTVILLAHDPAPKLNHDLYVQRYAQDIAKMRHFKPGDTRFAQVDKQLTAYSQGMVAQYLDPGMAHDFQGDLHKSFIKDAPRGSYSINGQSFPYTPDRGADPVINAFTSAVKDPKQRMVFSVFMSQLTGSNPIGLSQRMPLPPTTGYKEGLNLAGVEGMDMIISSEAGGDTLYRMPRTQVKHTTYSLDIAPDGKSAKVSVRTSGNITHSLIDIDSGYDSLVGRFDWTQEFSFDLSGDTPKLVSAKIGQSIDASIDLTTGRLVDDNAI